MKSVLKLMQSWYFFHIDFSLLMVKFYHVIVELVGEQKCSKMCSLVSTNTNPFFSHDFGPLLHYDIHDKSLFDIYYQYLLDIV